MSKLVLYVMADFETSLRPDKEKSVYAWLTGFKICGLMDLESKSWVDWDYLNLPKDIKYYYGKGALKNWLQGIFEVSKICKENTIEVHVFFHNAKYDFSYIQYYILKYCSAYNNKGKSYYMNNLVIDENNTFYSCKINEKTRIMIDGKRKQTTLSIIIHDLYKILPSKLASIGDSMKLPKGKDFDYKKVRAYDYVPTKQELEEYFFIDIEIMCVAYKKLPKFFYGKYTIGSIVKSYFINDHLTRLPNYAGKSGPDIAKELFPVEGYCCEYVFHKGELNLLNQVKIFDVLKRISKGYKGGMTIANNKYLGKTIYNDKLPLNYIPKSNKVKINTDIYHLDVNSLYPASMFDNDFPVGIPKVVYSDYEGNKKSFEKYLLSELDKGKKIIIQVKIKSGNVKRGKAPLFLKKDLSSELYNTVFDNTITEDNTYKSFYQTFFNVVEICTLEEFMLLKNNNYNLIYDIEYAVIYNGIKGLFKTFIKELSELKIFYDNDEFLRNCYKLCMNNLYGKFGEKIDKAILYKQLDNNGHWATGSGENGNVLKEQKGKFFFPPIAIYITSYARMKMINFINIVGWKNVLYCDTDSIHLMSKEGYDRLESNNCIDDTILGKLKLEDTCYGEKCLSPKKYVYYGYIHKKKKTDFKVKCAGLPEDGKALIKDFNQFDYGLTFIPSDMIKGENFEIKKGTKTISLPLPNNYVPVGKLAQKNIDGGIYLQPCLFSIKMPDVLKLHLKEIEDFDIELFIL